MNTRNPDEGILCQDEGAILTGGMHRAARAAKYSDSTLKDVGVLSCVRSLILIGLYCFQMMMTIDDYDDYDDYYLYIIGAVCLCVCRQKSLFLYSKDLVVSPVSRHIPYFKEFGRFHVS